VSLPRILVLVLAGGAGGRLELLTEDRAKPAVPFAGVYRLIDFPLSNCQHSQIADVWVSVQFHPTSLSDHLANGRPWDLDRTFGGLMVLPPFQGTDRGGWHTGTADSLWRNAELVRQFSPDALVVVSSDAVYKLDYREVVGQGCRMELHRHPDVGDLGVLAVAQREVDQPVDAGERDGRLGALVGEQLEAPSGSTGEDEDEDAGKGHGVRLPLSVSDDAQDQSHLYST